MKPRTKKSSAIIGGYRSGLEEEVAFQLSQAGVKAKYEPIKIKYTIPASEHTYTPDYILPNGIVIETKGRFLLESSYGDWCSKHGFLFADKQVPQEWIDETNSTYEELLSTTLNIG